MKLTISTQPLSVTYVLVMWNVWCRVGMFKFTHKYITSKIFNFLVGATNLFFVISQYFEKINCSDWRFVMCKVVTVIQQSFFFSDFLITWSLTVNLMKSTDDKSQRQTWISIILILFVNYFKDIIMPCHVIYFNFK